jgi:hypothetical protein
VSADIATPAVLDAEPLADYIEIFMLANPIEHLSISELRNEFPAGQEPTSAQISFAIGEIERRLGIAENAYPYRLSEGGILRQESDLTPAYDLMLLLSMENTPVRVDRNYGESDPLFDAVVREASARLFGEDGRSLVFGWPARDGRPENFSSAVTWVGEQLGIPDGVIDRPTEEKDAGVDVITWRPFADGRTAFPVYLFQNTIRSNYAAKAREVEPAMWHDWLRFGTMPSVGFAIPFAIPRNDDRWLKVSYSADVILDRIRIEEHIRQVPGAFPELELIKSFNSDQVAAIVSGDLAKKVTVTRPRRQRASAERDVRVR